MKKLILAIGLLFATSAFADGYYGHGLRHGGHYRSGGEWVAPLIIGGVIGYELNRARQPAPPPVVYAPPPPVYTPPPTPYGYHYENILDAYCNCYRVVLVPN